MNEPTSFGTPNEPNPQPPPERPRRSRRWWIIGAAVVVVAVGVTVALILTLTGGSSSPDRYGMRAVDVIRDLHMCDNPVVMVDAIASCGSVEVGTADNETDMGKLVAAGQVAGCTVVLKTYLINGPTVNDLTVALHADPKDFADKHHGYLVGDCS
jgi:hypothetical protein